MMKKEFKLSKFEHWLLIKIRNGGLLSKHVSGNKYEYMGYDWDETGKYVNASVVARLEKAGFLREVDISEMGAHRPFRQYFQNTDLANKLNWQYQTTTP